MQYGSLPNYFHFVLAVWGEDYTDLFLKVTLPNQLSPNNLPSFSYEGRLPNKYQIYTTSKDAEVIQNSPAYLRLSGIINTEFRIIDELINKANAGEINKYETQTIAHDSAIKEVINNNGAFVFLAPDTLCPDGTFVKMQKIAMTGKRVIIVGIICAVIETLVPQLLKYYSEKDFSITISSRKLVRLIYDHIHPRTKIKFWDSIPFLNAWPGNLYWNIEQEGVLLRGLHMNPLMIIPEKGDEPLYVPGGGSIDGDYSSRACPDFNDVYVAEDSDEMFFIALDKFESPKLPPEKASTLRVAEWVRKHASAHHNLIFPKKRIRFHFDELSPNWEKVEQESDRVVDAIFDCLDLFEKVPDAIEEIERLRAGQYRLISEVNRLRMDDAQAHSALGSELYKTGRKEEAVAAMEKSLSLFPNQAAVHRNLAVICEEQKNTGKAIEHIKHAIQLDPQNIEGWLIFVELLRQHSLNGELLGCLRQNVSSIPHDMRILQPLADLGVVKLHPA